MLSKKTVADPRSVYELLGSTKWVYDFGLKNLLTKEKGDHQADHIFSQRRNNTLIELIHYLGFMDAELIAQYYGFPDPKKFSVYVDWCWNDVAASSSWKGSGLEQINYFPHDILHPEFLRMMGKEQEENE